MAFIASLIPAALGGTAAAGTSAAIAAGTTAAGVGAMGGPMAAFLAADAGLGAATAAKAATGVLGTGMSLWQLAGLGFSTLSAAGTVAGNIEAAAAQQFQIASQLEAGALEAQRTRREVERQGQQLQARRFASLAAQGGTGTGSAFSLLAEPVMETSLEGIQRLADLDIQSGVLRRRSSYVSRGTARANIGAIGSGAARIFSLLDR